MNKARLLKFGRAVPKRTSTDRSEFIGDDRGDLLIVEAMDRSLFSC
jgi:hypothetical protein